MLINLLPRLGAKDSSEIKNIVTTTDNLFRYSQEEQGADPATKEALRYRTALYEGFVQLQRKPLCTNTAVAQHGAIPPYPSLNRQMPPEQRQRDAEKHHTYSHQCQHLRPYHI
ncbi:Fic/DOC family N-terminal domain-containing protein [Marinobacter antarcticus]|uniref:Fic/DOC family N-terminal domain-containing protein n=1 Tax=Marinobacter antarcticus TaxID=564117 RepID=UPI001C316EE4|nr:Fic/DOC family N-terminal domain-containing protein [Marinobacter antarcticus]